jgi:hypothetical protein
MAYRKALSRNERHDLVTSLEHIVTVGCVKRDEVKRRCDAAALDDENHNLRTKRLRHAEDARLFETATEKRTQQDANWEYEHGYDIDLYAFYETSQRKTRCVENKSFTRVPREIVLRCWERAVQAASNQIKNTGTEKINTEIDEKEDLLTDKERVVESTMDDSGDDQKVDDDASNKESTHRNTNVVVITPDDSIRRCHELNIPSVDKVCLRCGLLFDSVQQCRQHFHGTNKVLGCCWQLVKEKERALMRTLLEGEVKASTNLVVQRLSEAIEPTTKLGWRQILHALDSSDENPMLSPVVVENIKRRVHQRYAHLPL